MSKNERDVGGPPKKKKVGPVQREGTDPPKLVEDTGEGIIFLWREKDKASAIIEKGKKKPMSPFGKEIPLEQPRARIF